MNETEPSWIEYCIKRLESIVPSWKCGMARAELETLRSEVKRLERELAVARLPDGSTVFSHWND